MKGTTSNLTGSVSIYQINEHILVFRDFNPYDSLFGVNAVSINSNKSIIFVDSGFNPSCGRLMWETTTQNFERFHEKEKILILTHHHFDHSFGMSFFQDQDAVVFGHKKIIPYLEKNTEKYVKAAYSTRFPDEVPKNIYNDVKLSAPDIFITKDGFIDDSEVEVLVTPGHSPDSISVFHHPTRTMITGDSLIEQPVSPTIPMEDVPITVYQQSVDKIMSYDSCISVLGHGPIRENVRTHDE